MLFAVRWLRFECSLCAAISFLGQRPIKRSSTNQLDEISNRLLHITIVYRFYSETMDIGVALSNHRAIPKWFSEYFQSKNISNNSRIRETLILLSNQRRTQWNVLLHKTYKQFHQSSRLPLFLLKISFVYSNGLYIQQHSEWIHKQNWQQYKNESQRRQLCVCMFVDFYFAIVQSYNSLN